MPTKLETGLPNEAVSAHRRGKRFRVVEHSRSAIRRAIPAARSLVSHGPGAIKSTQAGAAAATGVLQTMPDSTLRGLAGSSVGLATGFYLARVPRVVTAAAVAPALALGWAMLVRPRDRVAAPGTESMSGRRAAARG